MELSIKLDKSNAKKRPLYEQIRDEITRSIESEQIKAGEQLPSTSALVKKWGIDYATVKSAFKLLEDDGLIRQAPRRRAVVVDRSPRTHNIMCIRWVLNALSVGISDGVAQVCEQQEQECMCFEAQGDMDNLVGLLENPPQEIDGIIVQPFETEGIRKAMLNLIARGILIVQVDCRLTDLPISSVVSDHFLGTYRAVNHLFEQHDCPVYYLGLVDHASSTRDAFRAWKEAMLEHGFSEWGRYCLDMVDFAANRGEAMELSCKMACELFSRGEQTYSIMACDDHVAQGVYAAAEKSGLTIGRDVFLVGFDDLPVCAKLSPSLTSVRQPREKLGVEAARLLLQQLDAKLRQPVHRVLPTELNIRESSVCSR
ncbi:MAG: GntR family transcriptional regulator [Sedimentisphaerales bacterium]|nr:GntR family transcriptional regulator [Sedimentisphaerales bacterium]